MALSSPPMSPTPTPAERLEWWRTKVWARWLQKHAKKVTVNYAKWVTDQLEDTLMPIAMLIALTIVTAIVAPMLSSKILAASVGLALHAHASYYAMNDMVQERAYRDIARQFFWGSSIVLFAVSIVMTIISVAVWIIG
jgi:hypothetical protein